MSSASICSMPSSSASINKSFIVSVDACAKEAVLRLSDSNSSKALVTAKFFRDPADGSALVSQIDGQAKPVHVLLLLDLLSEFVVGQKSPSKLFCVGSPFVNLLKEIKDFKHENIDRLLIRSRPVSTRSTRSLPPREVVISAVTSADATPSLYEGMVQLLRDHCYWGKSVDETYVRNAVNASTVVIAREVDSSRVVGLARYISTGDLAYISDMVVESKWRRQAIGTCLMQEVCNDIDSKGHSTTILIVASMEDGKIAAGPLYEQKFSFVKYDEFLRSGAPHHQNIFFKYLKR